MTEEQRREYDAPEDATPENPEPESSALEDSQDYKGRYESPEPALQPPAPDPHYSEGAVNGSNTDSGADSAQLHSGGSTAHTGQFAATSSPSPLPQDRTQPRYEYPPPTYGTASTLNGGGVNYPPPPPRQTTSQYSLAEEGRLTQSREATKDFWNSEKSPLVISAAGLVGLFISLIMLFSSAFSDTEVGAGVSLLITTFLLLLSLGASIWGASLAVSRLFKKEDDNKGYHAAAILTAVMTVPLAFFFIILALVASLSLWFGNIF